LSVNSHNFKDFGANLNSQPSSETNMAFKKSENKSKKLKNDKFTRSKKLQIKNKNNGVRSF
jgi:hypothetical protein